MIDLVRASNREGEIDAREFFIRRQSLGKRAVVLDAAGVRLFHLVDLRRLLFLWQGIVVQVVIAIFFVESPEVAGSAILIDILLD